MRVRVWFCFLEHRDFDDPGTEDLINEFRGRVGPEACRRTAPGYAHGQVRTHGQTLLFYRYRCQLRHRIFSHGFQQKIRFKVSSDTIIG